MTVPITRRRILLLSHALVGLVGFQIGLMATSFSWGADDGYRRKLEASDDGYRRKLEAPLTRNLQLDTQPTQKVDTLEDGDKKMLFFPPSVSKLVHAATTIPRDEFTSYLGKGGLGLPLEPTTSGNEEVVLLYPSAPSMPNNMNNASQNSAEQALSGCAELKLIVQKPKVKSDTCYAILGQWETGLAHTQRYLRLRNEPQSTGQEEQYYSIPDESAFSMNNPLRFVSRTHNRRGGRMNFPEPKKQSLYRSRLVDYFSKLPQTLDKLRGIAAAAAAEASTNNNTVIVMVCNWGQAELLMNFVCSAKSRGLNQALRQVIVFATDTETADLAESLGLKVFRFMDILGGGMPTAAAQKMGDDTFGRMTLAKVYAAHLISSLGTYHFLLQDVDIVWYQNPLESFFDKQLQEQDSFDLWFQDDGARSDMQYSYSANTGFYFCRNTLRSRFYFEQLVRQGDLMLMRNIDQPMMNLFLNEHASWMGLRVKILGKESGIGQQFPTGQTYNMNKPYMKEFMKGNKSPYIFHMNWTRNKQHKVLFFQQMGDWFVKDQCMEQQAAPTSTTSTTGDYSSSQQQECCSLEPIVKCHFRDKPSKIPCRESPPFEGRRKSFW